MSVVPPYEGLNALELGRIARKVELRLEEDNELIICDRPVDRSLDVVAP